MAILGSDIADYQNNATIKATGHDIDFAAYVAAGRRFVITKATEGTGYRNKYLPRNRDEAHRHGCALVGLYHFARPGKSAALAEADHFLATIGALAAGEVAVLDIETNAGLSKAALGQWAADWLDRVAKPTGRRPGLYSYLPFLQGMDTAALVDKAWLWVAAYQSKAPGSDRWPRWEIWQYTSTASVPGIIGDVDDNRFRNDSISDLAALGGAAPAPAPPQQEDDPTMRMFHPKGDAIYLVAGDTYTHVKDEPTFWALSAAGIRVDDIDAAAWAALIGSVLKLAT